MKRFMGIKPGNDFLPSACGGMSQWLGEMKALGPRRKAWGIVKGAPEAVSAFEPRTAGSMKRGGGNVCRSPYDRTLYMTRHGTLEAEDEAGCRYVGLEAVRTLQKGWCLEASRRRADERLVCSEVLGLPGNHDRKAFETACRSWAREHLKGHPWIMCFHYDVPGFPHAHLLFRNRDLETGKAYTSKSQDVHRLLREDFAARLCEAGIEANATRRATRGMHLPRVGSIRKRKDGPGWMPKAKREAIEAQARRMADGLEGPDPVAAVIREHRRQIFGYAAAFARELRATGDAGDAELARRLEQYYRDMPPYRNLAEQRALEIIREREERAAEAERGAPAEPGRGMER